MTEVTIVDYGMGNLTSVAHAFEFLGARTRRATTANEVSVAEVLVLPGVGAYPQAMEHLRATGLQEALFRRVIDDRRPILGICLGMQLLAESSEENGYCDGLGWLSGQVRPIPVPSGVPLPHVGWNSVDWRWDNASLSAALPDGAHFYFDHSFALLNTDADILATTDYGGEVVVAVAQDNVMGMQFHPEKSQNNGLKLLRGFLNLAAEYERC